MLAVWATVVAVILAAAVQAAEPVAWRIVSVHDGDTVTAIDPANTQHRIRLQGIDAPEIGQAFGTKSRDRLTTLVKGKTVPVVVEGHDRFGRVLARIQIDGRDLGEQLVGEGMAWHYARFDKSPALAAAQRDARAARRGLWADREPSPPW
jgi:endonuclease YncB( thermonuclease family)